MSLGDFPMQFANNRVEYKRFSICITRKINIFCSAENIILNKREPKIEPCGTPDVIEFC